MFSERNSPDVPTVAVCPNDIGISFRVSYEPSLVQEWEARVRYGSQQEQKKAGVVVSCSLRLRVARARQ